LGYPDGIYRVGPLARLNVIDRCGTPKADQEWAEFRALRRGVILSSFHQHYARFRVAIFIHGCFWHGHNCQNFRPATTRAEWWSAKIASNKARDELARQSLEQQGWRVVTLFECELVPSNLEGLPELIRRLGASEALLASPCEIQTTSWESWSTIGLNWPDEQIRLKKKPEGKM
jgi:DNA mismatch endonuclease Vsr